MMLIAGLFPQFFWTFCDRNGTIRMMNWKVSNGHRYWLRLLLIICRVTVKLELQKHAFLELKHENSTKREQKYATAS